MLTVGIFAVFLALALSVLAVGAYATERGREARMTELVHRLGGGTAAAVPPAPAADRIVKPLWRVLIGLTRRICGADVSTRVQHRLDLAGNPDRWTVERILACKGLGLITGGTFGLLVGHRAPGLALVLGAAGAGCGFFLPNVLLYNAGLKRQAMVGKRLPDALDLLVICVQAGLGFDAALAHVARNTSGPLAGEFSRVLSEMHIGKSRPEALKAMGERTGCADVQRFVGAIVQADSLGIPVSHVLREQAKEMRTRRRQRAEEQAQKVPVKILFPLILFILPALLVVILGPAAMQVMHLFGRLGAH